MDAWVGLIVGEKVIPDAHSLLARLQGEDHDIMYKDHDDKGWTPVARISLNENGFIEISNGLGEVAVYTPITFFHSLIFSLNG